MKTNEVYKITNTITNKIYIGITNQGSGTRYRKHWYDARTGDPCPIHRSMAKYGEENFKLEIIDFADTYEELKEKEKYWIKYYDSNNREKGYNLTEGGDGTFGRFHSEETKEKIRQKAIGRKASEETKKKMSEQRKGKFTERAKKHLLDIVDMGKRKVTVSFLNENKEIINTVTYDSIIECSTNLKLHRGTITRAISNTNGYIKKINAIVSFVHDTRYYNLTDNANQAA